MKEISHKKELRNFGLIVGSTITIIFGFVIPIINGHSIARSALIIGITLIILGIIKPSFLFLIYKLWIKLGYLLGYFNSRLILGLVFIFMLQPIALLIRIVGYDPLQNKRLNKKSYFEKIHNKKIDLERIF